MYRLAMITVLAVGTMYAPSVARACNPGALHAAELEGDAAAVTAALRKLETAGGCSGETLDQHGRRAAIALYKRAFAAGTDAAARRNLLEDAVKLGRPWQVIAALADEMRAVRRYAEAARQYQDALDDIRNSRLNPASPPRTVIAALVKKAEASSLLAAEHVPRVDRNGRPGGLACPTFRDLVVVSTVVPIEFEYREPGDKKTGVDALTTKGHAAADDLAGYLVGQRVLAVHLIGHTDARGGADYNLALSNRRAEALKTYLVAKGFSGEIRTSGRGLTQPFQPEEPSGYTQEERWQMDRRVELEQRGGAGCSG
jgi:OmpA-OmpF porin, OOP family